MPNQKWERQELESVKLCKTRLEVILKNPSIREPLIKSRVAATVAFRDGMREARRS
jgi:phosphotransferase system IIB component